MLRRTTSLAALGVVILSAALAVALLATSTSLRNLRALVPGGEHPRIAWDASARVGIPYRFELATHCGVDYARFHHRWWEAAPRLPEDHTQWGSNFTWGTMTLLDDKTATFKSDAGRVVKFVPVPAARLVGSPPHESPTRQTADGRLVSYTCA
jgi:hypothetical protein